MGWIILLLVLVGIGLALASFVRLGVCLGQDCMGVEVGWLGHRVGFDLRRRMLDWWWLGLHLLHRSIPKNEAKHKPRKQAQASPSITSVWQQRPKIIRLLRYLRRHLRWEQFEVWLRLCTPDPALTGMLYGFLCAFPLKIKRHLQAEPDFMQDWPLGRLEAALKIRTFDVLVLGWQGFSLARAVSPRAKQERSMVWKAKTS